MKFAEFVDTVSCSYTSNLKDLAQRVADGRIRLERPSSGPIPANPIVTPQLYFPNIALFVETEHHLICELFGAQETFAGLTIKRHKQKSYSSYFGQFEIEPTGSAVVHISHPESFMTFNGHVFSRDNDRDIAQERLRIDLNRYPRFVTPTGKGSLVIMSVHSGTLVLDNVVLINKNVDLFRIKHIGHVLTVSKSGTLQIPSNANSQGLALSFGANVRWDESDVNATLAQQFTNLFLIPGLRETTIGEFLKNNPSFVRQAFGCSEFVYEPEFEWIEGNSNPDERSINPDLLFKRPDGCFDIVDFKTPLLDRKSIAKGGHRRRRFIDYVHEGLAQLANYRQYFDFSKNCQHAKEKYGISVNNPKLFLIVGNMENAPKEEIEEAARMLGRDSAFRIIDYDTLNALYCCSNRS